MSWDNVRKLLEETYTETHGVERPRTPRVAFCILLLGGKMRQDENRLTESYIVRFRFNEE